ncbi:LysR family transcriptional regulator [Paenibacillus sp. RC67]|uniref:LysR family transcriptional regulator n=1 Tax=Paenibacillus sp. RC67 TaxID=3039392 RepID=UPI0024ADC088|nr:LysR family transcriptional regulator [Paenibacillus sp. RC67]
MDIKQLRYFIAIAEEKQISGAAKRLHMAQPPLSQQLKHLEEELGVPLVIRRARGLELTEAGHVLYKHALNMEKYMDQTRREVKETGEGLKGLLTVGVNTLSSEELPQLLLQFKARYPDITYKIQQNESAQLCKLVKERIIELALIRFPIDFSDFSYLHVKSEPFYLVTSQALPGIGDKITYEQIGRLPLIIPSTDGLGLHQMIVEQLSRSALEVNVLCECSDIAMLLELVANGFGSAILPEVVLRLHQRNDIHIYPIADSTWTTSSGFIWLKDHYLSQGAKHFIELWKEYK